MRILAISGSLRKASSNTDLLRASAILAPPGVEIAIYENLSDLPYFNPDLENEEISSVTDFRKRIRSADGVLIASPEYAHGITGVLKNGLDWIVGSGELVHKPTALLNASFRATHAYEALKEVLKTMDARIIPQASLVIPLPNNKIGLNGILEHPELVRTLQKAIEALACAISPDACQMSLTF